MLKVRLEPVIETRTLSQGRKNALREAVGTLKRGGWEVELIGIDELEMATPSKNSITTLREGGYYRGIGKGGLLSYASFRKEMAAGTHHYLLLSSDQRMLVLIRIKGETVHFAYGYNNSKDPGDTHAVVSKLIQATIPLADLEKVLEDTSWGRITPYTPTHMRIRNAISAQQRAGQYYTPVVQAELKTLTREEAFVCYDWQDTWPPVPATS